VNPLPLVMQSAKHFVDFLVGRLKIN